MDLCLQCACLHATTSEPLALTLRACFALPFALCVCLSLLACCCTAAPRSPARCAALPCPATHAPPLPTPRPARERPEGLRRRRAVAALRLSCARENCTVCTAPRLCPPTTAHSPPPPPSTSLPRPATTATPPTHRSLLPPPFPPPRATDRPTATPFAPSALPACLSNRFDQIRPHSLVCSNIFSTTSSPPRDLLLFPRPRNSWRFVYRSRA